MRIFCLLSSAVAALPNPGESIVNQAMSIVSALRGAFSSTSDHADDVDRLTDDELWEKCQLVPRVFRPMKLSRTEPFRLLCKSRLIAFSQTLNLPSLSAFFANTELHAKLALLQDILRTKNFEGSEISFRDIDFTLSNSFAFASTRIGESEIFSSLLASPDEFAMTEAVAKVFYSFGLRADYISAFCRDNLLPSSSSSVWTEVCLSPSPETVYDKLSASESFLVHYSTLSGHKTIPEIINSESRLPLEAGTPEHTMYMEIPFELDPFGKFACIRFRVGCVQLHRRFLDFKRLVGDDWEDRLAAFRGVNFSSLRTDLGIFIFSIPSLRATEWKHLKIAGQEDALLDQALSSKALRLFQLAADSEWPLLERVLLRGEEEGLETALNAEAAVMEEFRPEEFVQAVKKICAEFPESKPEICRQLPDAIVQTERFFFQHSDRDYVRKARQFLGLDRMRTRVMVESTSECPICSKDPGSQVLLHMAMDSSGKPEIIHSVCEECHSALYSRGQLQACTLCRADLSFQV